MFISQNSTILGHDQPAKHLIRQFFFLRQRFIYLAATTFLLCFLANLMLRRYLGSTPFRDGYLLVLGLGIPLRCCFLVWLWLVWFLDWPFLLSGSKMISKTR